MLCLEQRTLDGKTVRYLSLTLQCLITFDLMTNRSRMATGTVRQIVQSVALLKPSDRSQRSILRVDCRMTRALWN